MPGPATWGSTTLTVENLKRQWPTTIYPHNRLRSPGNPVLRHLGSHSAELWMIRKIAQEDEKFNPRPSSRTRFLHRAELRSHLSGSAFHQSRNTHLASSLGTHSFSLLLFTAMASPIKQSIHDTNSQDSPSTSVDQHQTFVLSNGSKLHSFPREEVPYAFAYNRNVLEL